MLAELFKLKMFYFTIRIESSQQQAFNTDKDCKLADTLVPADQTVDLGKEVSHLLSMIKVSKSAGFR